MDDGREWADYKEKRWRVLMAQAVKKNKPMETMATAQAVQEQATGEYCEDCSTKLNVTQYCSECGSSLCESCYSDEGHENHDE